MVKNTMNKALIIFAHPRFEKSRTNRALLAALAGCDFVRVHDLYEIYPDFNIDVAREQTLLFEHKLIVLQFPMYMYGPPALLKQWIDLVLEHGWAHGAGGCRLEKKQFFITVTTGGSRQAYGPAGFNRFTLAEMLRPLEQTAMLCRMIYLPPFAVQGVSRLTDLQLAGYAKKYLGSVRALARGDVSLDTLLRHEFLDAWAEGLSEQEAP